MIRFLVNTAMMGSVVYSSVVSANAPDQITIHACDYCDSYASMEAVAFAEASPVECYENPMLEGGVTVTGPSAPTENATQCFAPPSKLIIANPTTQVARKFIVQSPNPFTGHQGTISQETLNLDEEKILDAYYDLEEIIYESVKALNTGTPLNGSTLLQQASGASSATQSSADEVDEECLTSAAAHVFSSEENRNELLNQMRDSIAAEIDDSSWNEFTSSLQLSSVSSSSGVNISVGIDTRIGAGTEATVERERVSRPILAVPVGGESCNWLGLSCEGPTTDNVIIYDVTYSGDMNVDGINTLFLNFDMSVSLSFIEGSQVGAIFARGTKYEMDDPDSCLSQLVGDLDHDSPMLSNREIIGAPESFLIDGEEKLMCLNSTSVRACVASEEEHGGTTCEFIEVRHYAFNCN